MLRDKCKLNVILVRKSYASVLGTELSFAPGTCKVVPHPAPERKNLSKLFGVVDVESCAEPLEQSDLV